MNEPHPRCGNRNESGHHPPGLVQHTMGESETEPGAWLPDLDLNQDKQIQSLLCYRYTIGQFKA